MTHHDAVDGPYRPFVDGTERDGIETVAVEDPGTEEAFTQVHESGPERVREAVEAAESAFPAWSSRDGRERGRLLDAIAEALEAHRDRLGTLDSLETGRPVTSRKNIVDMAAAYFEYYAGVADKVRGETIPMDGDRLDYTVREPYGVSGQIVPWNGSLILAARGIAPALAAGNTVVAKADPKTPTVLIELARLASDVGLPDGVLNVVPGGVEATGEPLTRDSDVDVLTFTGSPTGGKNVMRAAADRVVPVVLELGGKSPSIVFPDADVERAVDGTLGAFNNAGQVCFATTRVFVHESIYDRFLDRLVEKTEGLSVGPRHEEPDIGPLISAEAQSRVSDMVDGAVEGGARVRAGGTVPRPDGYFYEPTVLDEVDDDAPISCTEVFGPVVTVYAFEDEQEVLARANDTTYGLYATVWTGDVGRAHRAAAALEAGTVTVNEFTATPPAAPFGGYKQSGLGRDQGMQAIEEYTQVKNVLVNIGDG